MPRWARMSSIERESETGGPGRDEVAGFTGDVSRRGLLQRLLVAGAVGGVTLPGSGAVAGALKLPDAKLLQTRPERYWARLRSEQFLLPKERALLNPASLGVVPRPVLDAVFRSLTQGAEYATDTVTRWGYETLDAERSEMAAFLGCDKDQLAFTHNCTESMNTIAHGLELRAGDEVLITDQEHPGGSACWRMRAARYGITVRAVEIPITPKQPDELTDRLISAIGPKTRVLSFSGITSPTGLVLPVQQICQAARAKGVVSVVDGAHMDGQVPVNLRELGCDYFAGSPHKWMFAPPGCGVLYGRDNLLDSLWPCVTTSGWDNPTGLRSARFMMLGTNGRSTIDGMIAGLRFLKELGEPVVYARMHQLARMALDEVRKRAYLEAVTPDDSRLFQAMVTLRFKAVPPESLWTALRARKVGVLGGQRMRLSFHIHTRPSDIQAFFETCDTVLRA